MYVATTGRGITKLSSGGDVPASTRVLSYTYDGLLRLIGAHEQPGTAYSFTYDMAGNQLQTRENGSLTHDRTYDAANQVVYDAVTAASWAYDAAGNRTSDGQSTYTYDALSRLVTATLGVQQRVNAYTGDGLLHAQGANGATTRYAQDLALPLPQVLATTGATTATFLYGADRLATVANGTRTWDIPDALGSVRLRLDDAGTPLQALRYDPWGTPQLGPQPQPFGFTGELHDPQLGLVNLRARWYDTRSGTFLQRDPYPGVAARPFSQHPYAYALASPVNYTDPSGRCLGYLWNDPTCQFAGTDYTRYDYAGAGKVVVTGLGVAATVVACGATAGVACAAGAAGAGAVTSWGNQALDNAGRPVYDAVTNIDWWAVGREAGIAGVTGPIGGFAGRGVGSICRIGPGCATAVGSAVGAASSGAGQFLTNVFDGDPCTDATDGVLGALALGGAVGGLTGRIGAWRNLKRAISAARATGNRAQAANPRPGAANAIVVGKRVFTGTSVKGSQAPTLHPEVQKALDEIPLIQQSDSHGRCAEPMCISEMLDAGVNPRGGVSVAVRVRAPGKPKHNELLPACESCEKLLEFFDIFDGAR